MISATPPPGAPGTTPVTSYQGGPRTPPGSKPARDRPPGFAPPSLCRLAYDARALAFIVPLALASLFLPPVASPTAAAWLVGGGLVVIGWSGRIWAQIHLGYRLPVRMSLTTCGPYRFLRNPIYCANTCVIVGAVTAFGCWWAVPVTVLWCAAFYAAVIRHEEARLRTSYGAAYRAYREDVARWVPRAASGAHGCQHSLSPRSLLAEAQVPVVLLPAAVKTFGLSAVVIASLFTRSWLPPH